MLLLEAATVLVMRLLVRALLLVILFFLKKVMQEVVQVKLLVSVLFLVMMLEEVMVASLFTSPPTPATRPCGACLAQNISKAGDPDLGRGERTNWRRNLPVARFLFLSARHLEGGRTINFCSSDRGWLFPLTRYRPPRDARHV